MNLLENIILYSIYILILIINISSILCDKSNDNFNDNCGDKPRNGRINRIVGGNDAFYGEVPWQVVLQVNKDNTVLQCGATLIDHNWVLTAAHCIQSAGTHCKDIKAVFGEFMNNKIGSDSLKKSFDDKNSNESNPMIKWLTNGHNKNILTRSAAKVIINSDFNSNTFENDIALIRLNQSIRVEDNIQPICLPQQSQDFSGQTGHVSGFGLLQYGTKRVPPVLQIVSVPILSSDYCDYMFNQLGYNDVVKYGKLCAGVIDGGKDACAGDSGGPLAVKRSEDNKWVLAGIISNGIKCGQPRTPGLYTQVSAYVDWIERIITSEDHYE